MKRRDIRFIGGPLPPAIHWWELWVWRVAVPLLALREVLQ